MKVKVAYGLKVGRNQRKATDKIHLVQDGTNLTLCGVDLAQSEILTYPMDGEMSEVNCKRCLKKQEN